MNIKNFKFLEENQYVIISQKNSSKKGTILDHGCASGLTMLPWIKKKWNAIGIDPHRPSVRLGKRKYKLNIKNALGKNYHSMIIRLI